jgi:transcriptional regulator with XRE-family HTH domain
MPQEAPKTIGSEQLALFCGLIKAARKKREVSQVELASRLGRPQTYVSKIERGEQRMDVVEMVRWAHALELTATSLMSEFEEAWSRPKPNVAKRGVTLR